MVYFKLSQSYILPQSIWKILGTHRKRNVSCKVIPSMAQKYAPHFRPPTTLLYFWRLKAHCSIVSFLFLSERQSCTGMDKSSESIHPAYPLGIVQAAEDFLIKCDDCSCHDMTWDSDTLRHDSEYFRIPSVYLHPLNVMLFEHSNELELFQQHYEKLHISRVVSELLSF